VTGDDAIITNDAAIHNGGVDANQAVIADCATMQRTVMGNRAVVAHNCPRTIADVNHDEVLNV
jgi:hypothetical protein